MRKEIKIRNRIIGEGCPLFIVAECGITCNYDIKIAKELIDVVQESGADAIKFIFWFPEEIMSDKTITYEYDTANGRKSENMFEMLDKLRFSIEQWQEIKAYADKKKSNKIIEGFVNNKPDLIYAMGTEAILELMKVIEDTPIVFTAVTNPVQTGITPDWETSGRNIAGNSNWISTEEILMSFRKVVPSLKTLGVMYNPDNPVSSMEVRVARETVTDLDLKLAEVEIKSVDDLTAATNSLINKKVEAIWVPIEKLVYKNMDKVKAVTDPAKTPLLASSHRGVKDGAIFGVVVDYHELGKISSSIALRILTQNVKPQDISIWTMSTYKTIINLKAVEEIDYDIPEKVVATANEVLN